MTPRLAVILAAAALAAAAAASSANAAGIVISGSQITSPSSPAYVYGESGSSARAVTISGTTTGLATAAVDLNCYSGSGAAKTLKANVPTNGNAFSVDLTESDIYNADNTRPCVLRAVPAGDTTARPPSSTADPYQGPRLFTTTGYQSTLGGPSDVQDFTYDVQGEEGGFQIQSALWGIDFSGLYDPSSLAIGEATIFNSNSFNGDRIQVDGTNSFVPGDASGVPGWLPIAEVHTSLDPATGNFTVEDREPLSKDTDPVGSYVPAGVELDRTWTTDDHGRVAHLVDTWRSTDGHQHSLALQYGSELGTSLSDGGAYDLPGGGGYRDYAINDTLPQASGPGTIYWKFDKTTPDAGDGVNPQGAVTYSDAPDGPPVIDYKGLNALEFTTPYNRTVPAGGSVILRFTWSQAFSRSDLESFAQQAIASYAPKAQPDPPANAPQPPVPPAAPAHHDDAAPALSLIGAIKTITNGFSFTLACTNGPCPGGATLTTTELLNGSKLSRLTAARTRRKQVTVGSAHFTIASGSHKTITVKLNAAGKKLLKKFKKLPATLTVTLDGKRVVAKQATLKPNKHR